MGGEPRRDQPPHDGDATGCTFVTYAGAIHMRSEGQSHAVLDAASTPAPLALPAREPQQRAPSDAAIAFIDDTKLGVVDQLVVRLRNGTITAFARDDGRTLWTRRLELSRRDRVIVWSAGASLLF